MFKFLSMRFKASFLAILLISTIIATTANAGCISDFFSSFFSTNVDNKGPIKRAFSAVVFVVVRISYIFRLFKRKKKTDKKTTPNEQKNNIKKEKDQNKIIKVNLSLEIDKIKGCDSCWISLPYYPVIIKEPEVYYKFSVEYLSKIFGYQIEPNTLLIDCKIEPEIKMNEVFKDGLDAKYKDFVIKCLPIPLSFFLKQKKKVKNKDMFTIPIPGLKIILQCKPCSINDDMTFEKDLLDRINICYKDPERLIYLKKERNFLEKEIVKSLFDAKLLDYNKNEDVVQGENSFNFDGIKELKELDRMRSIEGYY